MFLVDFQSEAIFIVALLDLFVCYKIYRIALRKNADQKIHIDQRTSQVYFINDIGLRPVGDNDDQPGPLETDNDPDYFDEFSRKISFLRRRST